MDDVEQEPDVNRLDVRGLRHHGGKEDIEGDQHCHARDVRRHDRLEVSLAIDVHGGLVDHVHHHSGQVRCEQKALNPPLQI